VLAPLIQFGHRRRPKLRAKEGNVTILVVKAPGPLTKEGDFGPAATGGLAGDLSAL